MDSKEYAWKWVTADEILSHRACDFIDAILVPDAAGSSTAVIYNGENTSGEVIISMRIGASQHQDVQPREPIYCRRGLYIDVGVNVRGILVQWRPRLAKEG